MANLEYKITQSDTAGVGIEEFQPTDLSLIDRYLINSNFQPGDTIELHIYSLNGEKLNSVYDYNQQKQLGNSSPKGELGPSVLYIDPKQDIVNYGFGQGDVKLLYHFLRVLSTSVYFISEISTDRTELKVKTNDSLPTAELNTILDNLQNSTYFSEFRLNFYNNDLIIGVNLRIDGEDLYIKLYEPLPESIQVKTQFYLAQKISNSYTFTVETQVVASPPVYTYLRGANFNLDVKENGSTPTEFLNYNTLYSYPVTSSYYRLLTQASSSGIEVSVDYNNYEEFVHFSSAQERLDNFKYKLNLIQSYESSSAAAATATTTAYYNDLLTGVISKFDGYENHLFFTSGAYAWPKSNSLPPYINEDVDGVTAIAWYNAQSVSASLYDELNESNLEYSIPEYLRQDPANIPYSLFLNMIGQHFDNIWVYVKAVTDKYDADNRLGYGVSKDLVADTLKSFGIKLYNSNFSVANLSSLLLGEWYDSGSEQINSFVTASNYPTPDKDILQETYKRIYHNLPYLIKTKGTERGLRALINCFGIPSGSLGIRTYGGINSFAGTPYYASAVSSSEKIRLDNTGSIVSGDTLSYYTSIQKDDKKYTQDLHNVEIAFSPAYNIDSYIKANITGSFDIDVYLGDPRSAYSSSYNSALYKTAETILSGSAAYDVFDFVRLIKFFDNQLFKMFKDFVPARDVVTSGIVIKPHILNRSKIKQVEPTGTRPEYSASIDTAFITGSNAGVLSTYSTAYTASVPTPQGILTVIRNTEVEKINGELGGSVLTVYTGSLNRNNTFLENDPPALTYNLTEYLSSDTPSAGLDELSEEDFFSTIPLSTGNMYFYWAYNKIVGYNYLKYIWFRHTSWNGVNVDNAVTEFNKIIVNGTEYSNFQKNVKSTTTIVILPDPGTGLSLNPASYPTTPAVVPVQLLPYVANRFYNSDYNATLNNALNIANAANVQKVDYSNNPNTPINIEAIRNATAQRAEVQEYIYNSAGLVRGKYTGKQLVASQVNEWTKGDTSYGTTAVIEQKTPYFCVFDYISGFSPEHNQASAIVITYIVDEEGNIITPDAPESQDILEQSFTAESLANISIQGASIGGTEATLLGEQTILRGGARLEPIVYSYTASQYLKPSYSPGYALEFDVEEGLATYDMSAQGSGAQNPSTSYPVKTTVTFGALVGSKDDAGNYNTGTSIYAFQADTAQTVKFTSFIETSGLPYYTPYGPESAEVEYKIEMSTDGTFSTGTTSTLAGQFVTYGVDQYVEVTLDSGYRNFNSGSAIRVVVQPQDPYLDTLTLTGRTFKAISYESGSTYVSQSDNGEGFYFATSSAATNTVLTASLSLSSKYENLFIGVVKPSGGSYITNTQGFNTVTQPFTVKPGDEIKFGNNENRSYLITHVETPSQNTEQRLYLTLNSKPVITVNKDFFAIRRYVDTSNMVLMRINRVAGTQNAGVLYPKYPTDKLAANYNNILSDLVNKGIL